MSAHAPVVIFAYRRPEHLRRTLASLLRCDGYADTPVFMYCDGPRDPADQPAVGATRKVAKYMLGDKAQYYFSEVNRGLSESVISGVGETVNRYGRVIVVEDDLELHPHFLSFMNSALDRYASDDRVGQISGYMFDVPVLRTKPHAVFLPFTVSWGWATWQRAWQSFDPAASGWQMLRSDRLLRKRFNLDGAYDYAAMLERQMAGQIDSWAVRWYWSVFKSRGMVLFPPVSMVQNTGLDGTGTHGRGVFWQRRQDAQAPVLTPVEFPESVGIDDVTYVSVTDALWRQQGGWMVSVLNRLRRLLRR